MTLRKIALALLGLASRALGWRSHTVASPLPHDDRVESQQQLKSLHALAMLMSEFSPSAAFMPSSLGNPSRAWSHPASKHHRLDRHVPVISMSDIVKESGQVPESYLQQRLPTQRRDILTALMVAATSPLVFSSPVSAKEKVPTASELSRLTFGLSRIDYLLENWDMITTSCTGITDNGAGEDKQVMVTLNSNKCFKTPLKVQRYIGTSSTLDPLFKADKLMLRAEELVPDEKKEKYAEMVDRWMTKQQMSSTMAYTSSWSGFENPNGSKEQIDENLLQAKKEVVDTQATLKTICELLSLPPAKKFDPADFDKKA